MNLMELSELLAADIGGDAAADLCRALARVAPGETLYVASKFGRPEILPTDTTASIRKKFRVSRTTAYNWTRRRGADMRSNRTHDAINVQISPEN